VPNVVCGNTDTEVLINPFRDSSSGVNCVLYLGQPAKTLGYITALLLLVWSVLLGYVDEQSDYRALAEFPRQNMTSFLSSSHDPVPPYHKLRSSFFLL
jgi:hypothetical protein